MGSSTFISAALHVAILLWVIVAFPSSKMESAPLVAIPIDLATPSEITKAKAGKKDATDEAALAGKPKEKPQQAVKEDTSKAPEQTASVEKKAEEAPPKPKPEKKPEKPVEKKPDKPAKKKADAAAPPPPQPKPPKPVEKPAPAKAAKADAPKKPAPKPKSQEFDTDRIAALLNKIPHAADEPEPLDLSEDSKPVHGQTDGTAISMSINELDALRARIAECWSPPPGGLGAESISVKIRLQLNEDGTLVGYPTVENFGSSPFFQAAADSAVRAVYQCQPYTLPIEKYAVWRDIILNFDPSAMYRSG
ncbi:MAG: hypothetical protein ACREDO_05195 [Methyloceanibacter sp.]